MFLDILKGEISGWWARAAQENRQQVRLMHLLSRPVGLLVCFDGMEISDKSVYRKPPAHYRRNADFSGRGVSGQYPHDYW